MNTPEEQEIPVRVNTGWRPEDGEQDVTQDPNVDLTEGPVVEGDDNE